MVRHTYCIRLSASLCPHHYTRRFRKLISYKLQKTTKLSLGLPWIHDACRRAPDSEASTAHLLVSLVVSWHLHSVLHLPNIQYLLLHWSQLLWLHETLMSGLGDLQFSSAMTYAYWQWIRERALVVLPQQAHLSGVGWLTAA